MRKLNTKTTILLGLLGVSAALVGVAACSSEDTVIPGDDSGVDSGVAEDSGVVDSGDVVEEASSDSGVIDSGWDSGWDAGADAGPDFDAGTEFDGGIVQNPITPTEFLTSMAQIYCGKSKGCCGAIPGTATFDLNKCVDVFKVQGWEGSAAGAAVPGVLDGGNLSFDPIEAKECLRQIALVSCVNTAATYKNVSDHCYKAFIGKKAIGGACAQTIECVPGSYCMKPDAGASPFTAPGTCAALKPIGATCNYDVQNAHNGLGVGECTYRASGVPAAYCAKNTAKCAPLVADGVFSGNFSPNMQCVSGALNVPTTITDFNNIPVEDDFTCGGTQALITTVETCNNTYAVKDGG